MNSTPERAFRFNHFVVRQPSASVVNGLSDAGGDRPIFSLFEQQHLAYCDALQQAGGKVTTLPPLDAYPDAVFVEDPAICFDGIAVTLRPGAPTRAGEAEAIEPALSILFPTVIPLPGHGTIEGGDVLLTDNEAFIGLSARTNQAGFDALREILEEHGYTVRRVETPETILHFKTDCGLLDSHTLFSSAQLAATGCFEGYDVIEAPVGEEAAANLVRVNDTVLINQGYPQTYALLQEYGQDKGFDVVTLDTREAAKIDAGLSCMSLRFRLDA